MKYQLFDKDPKSYVNPRMEDLFGISVCVDEMEDNTIRPRKISLPIRSAGQERISPSQEDLFGVMVCVGDGEDGQV